MIRPPHADSSERGFSLVEIVVVTGIVAMIVAIGYPRLATLSSIARLEGAVRVVALELQKTRLRAIAEGKCFQFGFNSSNGTIQTASKVGIVPCGTGGFVNEGPARKIDAAGAIGVAATGSTVFGPRGRASSTSVVTLTAASGDVRMVSVNAVGRVDVR